MILVNGKQQEYISVHDRGLNYGDGIFETCAVQNGKVLAWDRHLARLIRSCKRLGIEPPDQSLLNSEVNAICENTSLKILKIVISRGCGGRGYKIPSVHNTSRIVSLHDWPDEIEGKRSKGITLGESRICLGCTPHLAGLKHLNRLEQVLIAREADESENDELLVLDSGGYLVECSASNIFLIKDGGLYTPDLSDAGVEGIVRELILNGAPGLEMTCQITKLTLEDILQADEVFVCNSIIGLYSVNAFLDKTYASTSTGRKISDHLVEHHLISRL